jgi:hypothetical protein
MQLEQTVVFLSFNRINVGSPYLLERRLYLRIISRVFFVGKNRNGLLGLKQYKMEEENSYEEPGFTV